MAETVFTPALQGITQVKSENGEILAKPFLEACKHILPVLDKFGAAMSIVKSDIGGNISRLESKYSSDPAKFNFLYNMVKIEIEAKTAKGSSSCTNGLLWLTRAMDFLVELFRNLIEHLDWTMTQCCNDSYGKTLKKWHGWLASSSVTVAMKLAPDRNKFMEVLGGFDNVKLDIEKFLVTFSPLLQENHKFLSSSISSSREISMIKLSKTVSINKNAEAMVGEPAFCCKSYRNSGKGSSITEQDVMVHMLKFLHIGELITEDHHGMIKLNFNAAAQKNHYVQHH